MTPSPTEPERPARRRRGYRIAVLVLVIAAAVGVTIVISTGGRRSGSAFRYSESTRKGSVIAPTDRRAAGPVTGELLGGGRYTLAADRGRVVVLNLWGTWCGPCAVETPDFDTVYRQRRTQRVQFVGLDVKDGRGSVRDFVADKRISYPIVYDEKARTALQLGNLPLAGLPVSALVDKRGRVAAVYVGPVLPADLNRALDALVAEA